MQDGRWRLAEIFRQFVALRPGQQGDNGQMVCGVGNQAHQFALNRAVQQHLRAEMVDRLPDLQRADRNRIEFIDAPGYGCQGKCRGLKIGLDRFVPFPAIVVHATTLQTGKEAVVAVEDVSQMGTDGGFATF